MEYLFFTCSSCLGNLKQSDQGLFVCRYSSCLSKLEQSDEGLSICLQVLFLSE